jgi:phosphate starvation-inducible protein PhoH
MQQQPKRKTKRTATKFDSGKGQIKLVPMTDKQKEHIDALNTSSQVLIFGSAGTGKAQPLDSKIRTPYGWSSMGSMSVGDEVVTPKGTTTFVTGVYPQGVKDVYKVTFSDGRSARCCENHLWKVTHYRWKSPKVLSLKEILELQSTSLWVGLKIPMVSPELAEDSDLPLDPYLLGFLIGDGCLMGGVKFSNGDESVISGIKNHLPKGVRINHLKGYDYSIVSTEGRGNVVLDAARDLSLYGKKSYEKYVPHQYLLASPNQKLELLRGLMDTDGSGGSTPSFSTTSKSLADSVVDIVRSLGGKAKVSARQTKYTYKGEKKNGRVSYRVSIRYDNPKDLFKYAKFKKDSCTDNYQYKGCGLGISAVEFVGREECQCISVLDEDHLYITDDYIVTHNTYVSATYAANEYQLKNINKIVITRPHVSVGKELGFLKGDLEDKVKPWCAPVLDVLEEHLGKGVVDTAIKNNNIEMAPLALMRGRSFNNAIVLLDEAQNVTFQEIKMLTTRIGEGSTLIINGDLKQSDLKDTDGLTTIVSLVEKYNLPIPVIEYSIDDVVRSGITKQWLEVFDKEGI